MKKLMIVLVTVSCALSALAIERTPEQIARNKERRAAALAAKGGLVTKPRSGNVVRIVNAQKTVTTAELRQIAADIDKGFAVGLEVSEAEPGKCPFEDVKVALSQPKTAIVLLVVDDEKLPAILSAPENAWAILNVRTIGDDMPPRAVYQLRLKKEVARGLASACGAGTAFNKPCVMEPVYGKTDLDGLKAAVLGPETISKMLDAARMRGVEPVKIATYQQACQEGWAPAPTNDAQKAVWEKVHAMPEKPIKITYDPVKGE